MLQFPIDDGTGKKQAFFSRLIRLPRESDDFIALMAVLKDERTRIESINRTCTDPAEFHQNQGALQVLYDLEDAIERAELEVFGNKT